MWFQLLESARNGDTRMYTAAVLQPKSVEKLLHVMREKLDLEKHGFECVTPQGEPLPHHMTINLGPFDAKINKPEILGHEAVLIIDSLWFCKTIGACAARVTKAYVKSEQFTSINANKHITICLKPPAKPVDSNKIFETGEFVEIEHLLTLTAHIQEIQ